VQRYGYAFHGEAAAATRPRPSPATRWRLVWRGGEARLEDGEHVLGRDADLVVSLDFPTVSRRHARIRIGGERTTLLDLDSKNGTWVNGRRVEGEADLADGDEIRLGSLRLTFRRGGTASTQTVSSSR
jgi:pSer/pThr/pTyr-binding forkhead associated (FHA) protein